MDTESNTNKFIGMAMLVLVGIILIGSLLVPIISNTVEEGQYDNVPQANATDMRWGSLDLSQDHTITIPMVSIDACAVTIDGGQSYGISSLFETGKESTFIYSEFFCIRTTGTSGIYLTTEGVSFVRVFGSDNNSDITITISSGTAQIVMSSGNTYTIENVEHLAVPSADGDLILAASSSTKYVRADSEIFVCGIISAPVNGVANRVQTSILNIGTIDDLEVTVFCTTPGFTATASPLNTHAGTPVGSVYKIAPLTCTITVEDASDNSATFGASYTYFLVPAHITGDNYIGGGSEALLLAIPIIIIAALLMLVIRSAVLRRSE